jgi:hypothetical protein
VRRGESAHFIRGHNARIAHGMKKPGLGYVIDAVTGCWVWQRSLTPQGYGQLWVDNKHWIAHRYFYTLHRGAIPDGRPLDHLCRNRVCVNPEHLEPVTPEQNVHRGRATKLTAADVEAIRQATGTNRAVGERFGVGADHISAIRNGRARITTFEMEGVDRRMAPGV